MSQTRINAIDSTSVHRITAGQVVVDLQTAVKELVENSLDAGATSIEVRFKDYGLKSLEVIDNGHGVAPENYDRLALKHHTSKLASFEELGTVITFGFRGEALSSLCTLSSSITIITATADQTPMGTVLEFDRSGRVKHKSGKVARQRGTSVSVVGLFMPLPVRRKELEKNAKREYGKALALLQAYALVPCAGENKGVRLTVSNHPTKGAEGLVLSLWGPKSLDNIIALELDLEVEAEHSPVLKKRGIWQGGTTGIKVRGLISKFARGCGRTSADRQFFYVNGRPCNLNKIQKAFNEVYRSFNANQVPFVIADFQLPTNACDINVTPDKRTVFIHSENNLIQTLKTKLDDVFSLSRSTLSINEASRSMGAVCREMRSGQAGCPVSDPDPSNEENGQVEGSCSRDRSADLCKRITQNDISRGQKEASLSEISCRVAPASDELRRSSSQSHFNLREIEHVEPSRRDLEFAGVEMAVDKGLLSVSMDLSSPNQGNEELSSQYENGANDCSDGSSEPPTPFFLPLTNSALASQPVDPRSVSVEQPSTPLHSFDEIGAEERPRKRRRTTSPLLTQTNRPLQITLGTDSTARNCKVQFEQDDENGDKAKDNVGADGLGSRWSIPLTSETQPKNLDAKDGESFEDERGTEDGVDELEQSDMQSMIDELTEDELPNDTLTTDPANSGGTPDPGCHIIDLTDEFSDETGESSNPVSDNLDKIPDDHTIRQEIRITATPSSTLRFDLERLSSTWSRMRYRDYEEPTPSSQTSPSGRFRQSANVNNADNAEAAEQELSRIIHKEDFLSMHILDGKCGTDDLFIVDQHAADEKYNFETLQQTTKIESQKLFQPWPLELTVADELIAIDNVEILRANGFEVMIDEKADAGQGARLKLVAQPVSKGTTFDMKDLEELLHLMRDQPKGRMVRCSKARAMFAMRACRKSVMVGKALTSNQMSSVVRHLGRMVQPWNCPHGRPTMRHLVSLDKMDATRHDLNIDWTKFT